MSLKGWLGQLADITGLSDCQLNDYNGTGDRKLLFYLAVEDTAVNAALYEPNYQSTYSTASKKRPTINPETLAQVQQNLARNIIQPAIEPDERQTPNRVWQVVPTAKEPQAPAWVVGTLVHEAIALWRFPGAGFEKWVTARAGNYGLTDKVQLQNATDEVGRLLERFMAWELFPEIERDGQRFHELPYSYDLGYKIETGFIDLLFKHNGRWTIVDFKTDKIKHEAEVNQLLKKEKYEAQIRRYGTAIKALTDEQPRLLICLLNGPAGILIKRVPIEP
jgi:ATP-dependent exoDNAse (exonuclease V) beta subunit